MTNAQLKWKNEKPDKQGWWWILVPDRKPKIAQVINDCGHFIIFYNHNNWTFNNKEDAEYLNKCLWAGPIPEPTQ